MTSPLAVTGQYASVAPFFNTPTLPNVIDPNDQTRVRAYDFYENAYHNRPQAFTLTLRGEADEEQVTITLPSPKKLVEAVHRFLAVEFDYAIEPAVLDPTSTTPPTIAPDAMATMQYHLNQLFKREKIHSKFNNNKRFGLIRGDAIWHITADDTKDQGQRISVHTVDPRCYFTIPDTFDPTRIAGCYLVDTVPDPREKDKTKTVARVQKYTRTQDGDGNFTGEIISQLDLFTIGKWDERNLDPADIEKVQTIKPPTPLDSSITKLPIYHWRNKLVNDTDAFGNSELSGIEVLFNAMNQSITDEDLTLVMQGLGMYWTNAGPPRDAETGEETGYTIGPRQVIEVGEGQTFGRVTGVSSVAPFLDHIRFLDEYVGSGSGISDVATGRVDVAVAESGISLLLQLMPLIAANQEKELELIGVHDQMLYDLTHMWMPAYESINIPEVMVVTSIGDAMPVNREAQVNEVVGLISNVPPLITMQMAVDRLSKLGWTYPDDAVNAILADAAAVTAASDPYAGQGAPAGDGGAGGDVDDEALV